jgi:hypothetical protein
MWVSDGLQRRNRRIAMVAALLVIGCSTPTREARIETDADAAALSRIGWYAELAGSCWQGQDAYGRPTDRQCYQTQFGRYLRGTIDMGGAFLGDSVVGWDRDHNAIVMYFWSNGAPRGELLLSYEGEQLAFEQVDDSTSRRSRNVWARLQDGTIRVTTQSHDDETWKDGASTIYSRDGAAPPTFTAAKALSSSRSAQAGDLAWLGQLAGRCWRGNYADRSGSDTQCYAWQYPSVLRVSAAIEAGVESHAGDAVYFRTNEGVRMFYWSDAGHFGASTYRADGDRLVLQTSERARSIWRRTADGFIVDAQHQGDAGTWSSTRTIEYRAN